MFGFRDTRTVFSVKIITPEHKLSEYKMPPSVSTNFVIDNF